MKYKIKIAWYKNSTTFFSKLIRFKQKYISRVSNRYNVYSHVEIQIPYDQRLENKVSRIDIDLAKWWVNFIDPDYKMELFKKRWLWFSSSEMDNWVRFKFIKDKKWNWDYIDLEISPEKMEKILNFMYKNNGNWYWTFQIFFAQILGKNWKKRWTFFCSEIVAQIIQLLHISDDMCLLDSKFIAPAELMSIMDTREHFIW